MLRHWKPLTLFLRSAGAPLGNNVCERALKKAVLNRKTSYLGPKNPDSTQRRVLNDWIRTAGAQLPGVVDIADYDKVLAYLPHPYFMLPQFYTDDNFHPNGVGYGVQIAATPPHSLLGF
jgi:lysophospholipase L1-like esterase